MSTRPKQLDLLGWISTHQLPDPLPKLEALTSELVAAQRRAAEARSRAQAAADALVVEPTRERQLHRDRLNGAVELHELETARLTRRLEQARAGEREQQIGELRGQIGGLQARAAEAWKQTMAGLEMA
jgi:hypothetical protein